MLASRVIEEGSTLTEVFGGPATGAATCENNGPNTGRGFSESDWLEQPPVRSE